ncbi:16637_t:CDS:1, partial [Racocetra fulgida]
VALENVSCSGAMGTVEDIFFTDNYEPNSLPTAVLVAFDKYNGPTIVTPEGVPVVPIAPIQRTWESKSGMCLRLQIHHFLTWAITVHKSQGLTIPKAVIDLGKNEIAAGLSFVA